MLTSNLLFKQLKKIDGDISTFDKCIEQADASKLADCPNT